MTRGHFPHDETAIKLLRLALCNVLVSTCYFRLKISHESVRHPVRRMIHSSQRLKIIQSPCRQLAFLFTLVICMLPCPSVAEPLDKAVHAQVVQVPDGDSLTIVIDGHMSRVRLAEIDAPEGQQPFSDRSRKSLFDLCFWVEAELTGITKDEYGRMLARVTCNGIDANSEQVKRGLAWVYDDTKDDALRELQAKARAAGRGLWGAQSPLSPIPPWEWNDFF
jgi:endonuclease YncB( thermonuclease family)